MISPALPITEAEVADLVDLHCTRRDEVTTETERSYHAGRADYWSDYYLAHFCPSETSTVTLPASPRISPRPNPVTS
jgi:hypothetical protein